MVHTESFLDRYPEYEVTIGIEVHVQLTTATKIFCSCATQVGLEPNTSICQVCAGHPGSLPVLNERVADYAILLGLGTHSVIAEQSYFDRKHYFYPDLPKGYQITQQFQPICTEGKVLIRLSDGSEKTIRLNRIHIEEDAGKNVHATGGNESFVDLNRAGTPLLEVVSYPDISSAHEARLYLKALRGMVQYLGICTGNMEEGAFRADTNISVKKKGATALGTKCELKNINSFKFISDAIEYEIERQITLLENGGKVLQETRLWDTKNGCTVVMRTKEEAADYRYFPDPDLMPLTIDRSWIERMRNSLPELPYDKLKRFMSLGLTAAEAEILIDNPDIAAFFDAAQPLTQSKQLINWILRDLMGYLKDHKIKLADTQLTPQNCADLVSLVHQGAINTSVARDLFVEIVSTGVPVGQLVKERGLEQSLSEDQLHAMVLAVMAEHPDEVAQYRMTQNQRMLGFFVGKVVAKTAGKGNPKIINDLVRKLLGAG